MDTKGGKPRWGGHGGVTNWAIGTDMYTPMCIKLMTNKNLLYKKTNKKKQLKKKRQFDGFIYPQVAQIDEYFLCARLCAKCFTCSIL